MQRGWLQATAAALHCDGSCDGCVPARPAIAPPPSTHQLLPHPLLLRRHHRGARPGGGVQAGGADQPGRRRGGRSGGCRRPQRPGLLHGLHERRGPGRRHLHGVRPHLLQRLLARAHAVRGRSRAARLLWARAAAEPGACCCRGELPLPCSAPALVTWRCPCTHPLIPCSINISEGMSRRLRCMAPSCGVVCDEDKVGAGGQQQPWARATAGVQAACAGTRCHHWRCCRCWAACTCRVVAPTGGSVPCCDPAPPAGQEAAGGQQDAAGQVRANAARCGGRAWVWAWVHPARAGQARAACSPLRLSTPALFCLWRTVLMQPPNCEPGRAS